MQRPWLLFTSLALASTSLVGCATDVEDTDTSALEIRGHSIPHPQGDYTAEVNANGTGCPAGTWDVAISPDGETFTMTFSAYEVTVDPGQTFASKDCQLDVRLGSNGNVSYSIASFYYQGYVLLDTEGMQAEQRARYHFTGGGQPSTADRDLAGPYDDSYLFTDEIAPSNRNWSSCRRNDKLSIKTSLALKNDRNATGTGYANTQSVDSTLKFRLTHKQCP